METAHVETTLLQTAPVETSLVETLLLENHVSEGIPDDWSVWEVLEAVELVAATEGFFKLAVEPLDEPPIRNDEPKNKHKMFL